MLLTDTVGFIQKLPPGLVAAFRATLEELESADLLLHVVDVTHPKGYEQGQSVLKTLADLGLSEVPVVTALNKIDLLGGDGGEVTSPTDLPAGARKLLDELIRLYPNAVAVSAERRWGLESLAAKIGSVLAKQWENVQVLVPYGDEGAVRLFREHARVTDESYVDGGVRLVGQVPRRYAKLFQKYAAR